MGVRHRTLVVERPAAPSPTRRRSWRTALVGLAGLVTAVVVLAPPQAVEGVSMQPTIAEGDRVLVDPVAPWFGGWHRGDVVVLEAPRSTPGAPLLVKRIVAVGGDRVALADGRLEVNGRPVREAYADPDLIDSVYFGPVTVAAGEVFVLGDNRAESTDSRDFGAVPESSLRGLVRRVVWPVDHVAEVE